MAFTKDTIVGEILAAKPQAKALIEKYVGRPVADWEMAQAASMSLGTVAGYVGWNDEKVAEVLKELNAL